MKFKLRFRGEQEAAECALYLDDRGYCVKLMGAALMVSGFDVFRSDNPEDAAMIAECSFWPCDEHGNKVRWPTDADGKML